MQQSEILPKHRIKRFWTEVRPLKRDYPDFDDDREGEEYYRNQFRMIDLPDIHNFSVKFTFITHSIATTKRKTTKRITTPKTVNVTGGMQSMIQKPRNIVAKKAGSEKRKC